MTIEIIKIERPDDSKFDQAMRIYTKNLKLCLRQPPRVLRHILDKVNDGDYGDQNYHIFLARKTDEPIGMMTLNYFPDVNVGFIGYIVIARKYWGQGIGRALYQKGRDQIDSDAYARNREKAAALVYEVSKINVHDKIEKQEDINRIRFFNSLGGYIIEGIKYYQPPLRKSDPPTSLYLMIHPFSETLLLNFKQDWVARLIRSIFEHVYRLECPLSETETEMHINKIIASIEPLNLHLLNETLL